MDKEREEYLANYCANKNCTNKNSSECDNCMYQKGRVDAAQDLLDIFDYDLFLAYSNDDRFISFNNLSLMIREVVNNG